MRGALLAAVAAVLVAPGAAQAATYVVTKTDDHVDPAGCTAEDCTLREAFAKAEDDDEIQLGAGIYRIASELTSKSHVELIGAGARSTVIDGADKTRLLNVQGASLYVLGVHFAHGNAGAGEGGAIAVQPDAMLTLRDSAVTDSAASVGGGIVSQGDLYLDRSLVARNTVAKGGGGVAAYGSGSLELRTTTVSDNHALEGNGGGVYADVTLSLESTTIAGNEANTGGGIYRGMNEMMSVSARNTVVADNTPASCGGTLGAPETTHTDYNVVDDGSCPVLGEHDQPQADPQLEPLADNGGPTDTRALPPGSPAVDGGDPDNCPSTDQRGIPRPQGRACDVGAFESPTTATAPVERISGRPLDVYADGLGRLQIRFNDDPRGVFGPPGSDSADAGLAFVADGLYYAAGGPDNGEAGDRTPVSGPRVTTVDGRTRRIESTYYVGPKLLVTEEVTMRDGERTVGLHYTIENVSDAAVDFRAAELATFTDPVSGTRGDGRLNATAANGAVVSLLETTPWHGSAIGAFGGNSDVYQAFAGGGIESSIADGTNNDLIGADWAFSGIKPGETRDIDVSWELAEPKQVVTVTTTDDHDDGECDTEDCTLREAMEHAPAGAVIKLPARTYELEHGQLDVEGHRVIRGDGARRTIIKAAPNARIFSGLGASLGISGVTLTGGNPQPDGSTDQGEGGAIRMLGSNDVGFDGGLAIADSVVTGNSASNAGGVYALGGLTIDRTAITNNVAHTIEDGGGGAAGGLAALAPRAWIVNTTISGNRAQQGGGGAYTLGAFHYINTTIADNTAPIGAGLVAVIEGGDPEGPPIDSRTIVDGTIVAGNRGGPQCLMEGLPRSSHSLAGDTSCGFRGDGDRENVDAVLAPLGDYGGPSETHALLAGSPAIDSAGPANCPTTDQRGEPRPFGEACDAGAFEGSILAPPAAPAIDAPSEGAVLNRSDVAVSGTAAPQSTITLTLDGGAAVETTANQNGAWSRTLDVADGDHTLTATATNDNGTSAARTRHFRVDTTPPESPAVGGPEDVQATTVTLTGQAEPDSEVTIYDGSIPVGTTTAGGDGAWSFTVNNVPPGEHAYSAEARDRAGNVSPRSPARAVRVSQPPQSTPTPTPVPPPTPTPNPPTGELPPPVPQQNVNVEVKSGTIKVKVPGTNKFVELEAGRQIPVGTTVDTTKGRVTLTSAADKNGRTQTADFYSGIFRITQTKGAKPVTVLRLVEAISCTSGKRASAAAKKKKSRRLWGDGKGSFRTVGKYSSATVRGTKWLTEDRCDSTLVKVAKGVVAVRDNVKHKTKILRKGKRYIARKRVR